MIEFSSVKHNIQKNIIDLLTYQKYARFSDLRPSRVDTNLFTYHLKALVKNGMLEKTTAGYTLGAAGLAYVDRVNSKGKLVRTQPKIITMLVVQNSDGDILLQKLTKQPYIDSWTLPYGKLHIEDTSVLAAVEREMQEKLGVDVSAVTRQVDELVAPEHAGDCYIRVISDGEVVSLTLVHVFRWYYDDIVTNENLLWARPHKLSELSLAPAVADIMTRTFFKDPFYFEEFDVDWYSEGYES